jgi:hypothetical protein
MVTIFTALFKGKGKHKVVHVQAVKAYEDSRSTAPLLFY